MPKKSAPPAPKKPENLRQQIRFSPDENALAEVVFPDGDDGQKVGLLYEESAGGCSVVFLADPLFHVDRRVFLKAGKLARLGAEIKWIREVHPRVVRVGFRYLE